MSKFGLYSQGEEKNFLRREETFRGNCGLSEPGGTQQSIVLEEWRLLGEVIKVEELARGNPTRGSSVSAWVPQSPEPKAKTKIWVQVVYSMADPRKQRIGRHSTGRRKSQAKRALPKSLLRATGAQTPIERP